MSCILLGTSGKSRGGRTICCLPQSFDHWPRIPFETEHREEGGVLDRRDVLDLMHSRSRLTIDPRIPTMPGRVEMGGGERVSFVWFSWEGKACLDVPIHPQAPYERLRTAFSKYRSEPIQEGYSSPHFNTPP